MPYSLAPVKYKKALIHSTFLQIFVPGEDVDMSVSSLRHLCIEKDPYADHICFDLSHILQAPHLQSLKIIGDEFSVRAASNSQMPNVLRLGYGRWSSRGEEKEMLIKAIEETLDQLGFGLSLKEVYAAKVGFCLKHVDVFRKNVLLSHSAASNSSMSRPAFHGALPTIVDEFGRLQIESNGYIALSLWKFCFL